MLGLYVGIVQLTRTANHHAACASQVKQQKLQQKHNLLQQCMFWLCCVQHCKRKHTLQ